MQIAKFFSHLEGHRRKELGPDLESVVRIRGSGSVPKRHGSTALVSAVSHHPAYTVNNYLEPVLEAGVQVLDILVDEAGELEMFLCPLGRLLLISLSQACTFVHR
jgi:hypothetical protein